MKRHEDLSALSNEEIVKRFEQLCIEQYDAMDREELGRVNRLVWRIHHLVMELKSRPGDQRRLLRRFFGHSNMQVRLSAAHANLAIDYPAARREIQDIANSKWEAQCLDAGMTLINLDNGIYRPS
ncbi:DUF2019 domain-containing protein [Bosea sp. (in: a-proteobacteria)]|uniref:DUF2019 domain-containing protein n=1 Tax=Bosea sp. (in: a-proteobacteria) TaxID=1871050 RepID=UPI0027358870|nr:DUF2019 domain-containing protein [Bosea sp. (in: a-proteobacteria)]MDP3255694.1 DUF2019 domain-containing protein [Bosea sp. (in: a-proteobacteria)]